MLRLRTFVRKGISRVRLVKTSAFFSIQIAAYGVGYWRSMRLFLKGLNFYWESLPEGYIAVILLKIESKTVTNGLLSREEYESVISKRTSSTQPEPC